MSKTKTYRAILTSQQIHEILGSWLLAKKGIVVRGNSPVNVSSLFIHETENVSPLKQVRIEVEVSAASTSTNQDFGSPYNDGPCDDGPMPW